ncbi:MAG: KAP family NTPase [Acidobacteria bacterium]|nr:KAP family NTPase [Acidobacteriota bacterium]
MLAERGERAAVNVINDPDWSTRDLSRRLAFDLREMGYLRAAQAAYQRILREAPNDAEAADALREINRELGQEQEPEESHAGTPPTETTSTATDSPPAPAGSIAPEGSADQIRPPAPDFTTATAIAERMREAAKLAADGKKDAAETLVSQLFRFAPDYDSIHLGARVLQSEGYLGGALRAYERLAEIDPDNYPVGPINSLREQLHKRDEEAARKEEKPSVEGAAADTSSPQPLPYSEGYMKVFKLAEVIRREIGLSAMDRTVLAVSLVASDAEPSTRVFLSTFGVGAHALLNALWRTYGRTSGLLNTVEFIGEFANEIEFDKIGLGPEDATPAGGRVSEVVSRAEELAREQGASEVGARHLFEALMENAPPAWVADVLGAKETALIQKVLAARRGQEITREDVLRQAVRERLFRNPPAQSDGASVVDLLGFEEHADALVDIIRKDETKPPLVVGVYGPWGSGKSTFMGLVKAKLEGAEERKQREKERAEERKKIGRLKFWWKGVRAQLRGVWSGLLAALRLRERPAPKLRIVTVEYDAWAYADTPKLWSGLVGRVAKELDAELGWWGRITYLWERHARKLLWAVLLGFVPVVVFAAAWTGGQLHSLAGTSRVREFFVKLIAVVVPVVTAARAALFLRSPVTDAVTSLASRFDTAHAAGVVSRIQDEFKTALQTRIAPDADDSDERRKSSLRRRIENNELKIVVFIDELDRCPLERIVDILEAIKLFLAEDLFIVFLGVDTRVAAEAIRLHYKEVRNPDLPREYLEKIVQLPLRVPTARGDSIRKFLENFMSVPKETNGRQAVASGADAQTIPPPSGAARAPNVSTASVSSSPSSAQPDAGAANNGGGARAATNDASAQPSQSSSESQELDLMTPGGATGHATGVVPRTAPPADAPRPVTLLRPQSALSSLPSLPDTQTELTFMARLAEEFLEGNPRRMKRLLNTYRYVKILSSVVGQPVEEDRWQERMLSWLAFTMKWPAFMERAIEVAEARVAEFKRAAPGASVTSTEEASPFLSELTREYGSPDEERPPQELIERYLAFNAGEVALHYELAGNFLVENPRAHAAAAGSAAGRNAATNAAIAKRQGTARKKRQPRPPAT